MDLKEIEIFGGKNASQLAEEIYRNSLDKRNQIDVIISELRSLVKGLNDAVMIVPLIKDQLDVGVKNDEQLLKLFAIIQRINANNENANSSDGGGMLISDEEKAAIMKEIEESQKINKKIDKKIQEGESSVLHKSKQ